MPSRQMIDEFVVMVEAGAFVEALKTYYADDAVAQENAEAPRIGLPALIAHEERTLIAFDAVTARCLAAVVDGDTVVINWMFEFTKAGRRRLRLDELAIQTWHNGRIVRERFYYDPAQLRRHPAHAERRR